MESTNKYFTKNKRMIKTTVSDIVSIISLIHDIYIYIYIRVQECVWIQTTTLWIYHVHLMCKKRSGNRFSLTSQ